MINDSYLEIHDDIIVIGVMYKYRLQLNMANYIYLASVADFKHHLYFLSKIITPDVFIEYLREWEAFIMLNRVVGQKKTVSLMKATHYYKERTEAKL